MVIQYYFHTYREQVVPTYEMVWHAYELLISKFEVPKKIKGSGKFRVQAAGDRGGNIYTEVAESDTYISRIQGIRLFHWGKNPIL